MRTIDPQTQTKRENYHLLTSTVIPRPIAFVTSVSEDGVVNGAPFSYFSIVSANPPTLSLAIQRNQDGTMKDTTRNILSTKEFVVHTVEEQYLAKINATSAPLPATESEIAHAHLTHISSERIETPGIREASVRFECTLAHALVLGNDETDLLIGEVVYYHIDDDLYQNGSLQSDSYQPMSRLGRSDYASIGEVRSIKRPT